MSDGFPRWLLRRPAEDAVARVFCFPYSGVGASMFNRWPRWIGGTGRVEVCPIQLPARENRIREPHFGTYQRLAEDLAGPLRPYLDRPFVLFGHCSGALPAFETAVRLARTGASAPGALVVSAQAPPHRCPHDRFLDLSDEQLITELDRIAVRRGGSVHGLLAELTLGVLHRDLDAGRAYHRERLRLPFPVSVVRWADDPEIELDLLRDWRGYARQVRLVELPGDHYEFLSAPDALLDLLAGPAVHDPAED